jgi:hypothetical protein
MSSRILKKPVSATGVIWFVSFVWLNETNQMNQRNQIDQMNVQ